MSTEIREVFGRGFPAGTKRAERGKWSCLDEVVMQHSSGVESYSPEHFRHSLHKVPSGLTPRLFLYPYPTTSQPHFRFHPHSHSHSRSQSHPLPSPFNSSRSPLDINIPTIRSCPFYPLLLISPEHRSIGFGEEGRMTNRTMGELGKAVVRAEWGLW